MGRMVQDKTFFQTELRQKINLLTAELNKLNHEAEATNRENSNYAAFEKRLVCH
jgi:intraflagellar transport protein 74